MEIEIDTLKISETYISSNTKSEKLDTGSSDAILRIEFINLLSKHIDEIKNVKTMINSKLPVGTFLKDTLEKYGFSTGIWKPGKTAYNTSQFINSSLPDIIEDMKTIDSNRDSGSLYTMFSDFRAKLHYMEIADLIKTVQPSADAKKIWFSSFGHEYGLGFFTAPNIIQSHEFGSPDMKTLIDNCSGMKVFSYNVDTKIITPVPGKSAMKPGDVYDSLPKINSGTDSIATSIFSDNNVIEYTMNYVTNSDADESRQIATNMALRPLAFSKYFQNNFLKVRLGFVNIEMEIVNEDGTLKNGITIEQVKEEPAKEGIAGVWMIAGIQHVMNGTQFYTDLELIRTGT